MGDIKTVTTVPTAGTSGGKTDLYLDFQLKSAMELIMDGNISLAMLKCADLKDKYKYNQQALKKVAAFMKQFDLPNLPTLSYSVKVAGDDAEHFDVLQELRYKQPLGKIFELDFSFKYFDGDKVAGSLGAAIHGGGFLDVFEYALFVEASLNYGDPQASLINPLSLFKVVGSLRYSFTYLRGYAGYNLDVGFYGDGQLGFTFNGLSLGGGYAYFPYFNVLSGQLENSQGPYLELSKYFQIGQRVGLYCLAKIPAGVLETGQLPLYFAFNLKTKINDRFAINLQGSYFYMKEYMQGMGGAGLDVSF